MTPGGAVQSTVMVAPATEATISPLLRSRSSTSDRVTVPGPVPTGWKVIWNRSASAAKPVDPPRTALSMVKVPSPLSIT